MTAFLWAMLVLNAFVAIVALASMAAGQRKGWSPATSVLLEGGIAIWAAYLLVTAP